MTKCLANLTARVQVSGDANHMPLQQPLASGGLGGIVLCTYGLCPGGAERQWIYLASGFLRMGVQVTFVTYEPLLGASAHYLPVLKNEGVAILDASELAAWEDPRLRSELQRLSDQLGLGTGELDCVLKLVTAFHQTKPQAVYAQLDEPNIFAGIAARVTGVERFIMSFRNHNPTTFPWIYRDWMLPSYRWLAAWNGIRYTSNSAAANASYAEWLGLPAEEIVLIPNMLGRSNRAAPSLEDLDEVRRELKLSPDDKVVLGVFRLHPEKDPQTFVHVARQVLNGFPKAKFILAGDGPLRAELLRFVEELGLGDRIALIGHRHDVSTLMSIATVLLHTSKWEGMSNVVMEAQSLGLPVVGPAIAGVAEAVDAPNSALLCQPGDVVSFAQALSSLLTSPDVRRKMAEASKRFAAARFDEQAVCERYLRIALEAGGPTLKAD
jgi:glycosyltransferase involved in cell wall biosynthesis